MIYIASILYAIIPVISLHKILKRTSRVDYQAFVAVNVDTYSCNHLIKKRDYSCSILLNRGPKPSARCILYKKFFFRSNFTISLYGPLFFLSFSSSLLLSDSVPFFLEFA